MSDGRVTLFLTSPHLPTVIAEPLDAEDFLPVSERMIVFTTNIHKSQTATDLSELSKYDPKDTRAPTDCWSNIRRLLNTSFLRVLSRA